MVLLLCHCRSGFLLLPLLLLRIIYATDKPTRGHHVTHVGVHGVIPQGTGVVCGPSSPGRDRLEGVDIEQVAKGV